jgi:GAF domain-containing protein
LDFPTIWKNIEEILTNPDQNGGWLTNLLPIILELSGLSWAFITEIFTGDEDHFAILAECPQVSALETRQSHFSGLAGLIHSKLKPLALPNLNPKDDLSIIFHPGDPLKKATSFYGWPLIYNQVPWGGLILVGSKGQVLNEEQTRFMDCLALRLASQLQQEKLIARILDLNGLDSQTGLTHRTQFLKRLERQLEIAQVRKHDLVLVVMGISGLGRHAVSHGQDATQELLRSLSLVLLQHAEESWEIGHISYGVFAISCPIKEEPNVKKAIIMFKKRLIDVFGQDGFNFHQAQTVNSPDLTKPERMLESALTVLAEQVN